MGWGKQPAVQLRLRVARLANIPPRLKPKTAPKKAAVNITLSVEPPLPRAKMKAVYAPATVQKASRRYMTSPPLEEFSHEILQRRNTRLGALDGGAV